MTTERLESQMRQKAEELYENTAGSKTALIKKGFEILAGAVRNNEWPRLIDEGKGEGRIVFSAGERSAVDAALKYISLRRFAGEPYEDWMENQTSPLVVSDLVGRDAGMFVSRNYAIDIVCAADGIIKWEFSEPMARAMEAFLRHRDQLVEKSKDFLSR